MTKTKLSDLKNVLPVNQSVCTIERGDKSLDLIICSPTPGYFDKLRAVGLYENLKAPSRPKRDALGKVIKINGNVVIEDDENDSDYLASLALQYKRTCAMQFKDVLRTDPTIEFDPEPAVTASAEEWRAYADALVDDLYNSSGITEQEVSAIITTAKKLANSLSIDEALKN
jgi:hypothetical protein